FRQGLPEKVPRPQGAKPPQLPAKTSRERGRRPSLPCRVAVPEGPPFLFGHPLGDKGVGVVCVRRGLHLIGAVFVDHIVLAVGLPGAPLRRSAIRPPRVLFHGFPPPCPQYPPPGGSLSPGW